MGDALIKPIDLALWTLLYVGEL